MQTLHLRFRDLRAIFLGRSPSRWPTPSMPDASTWETAPPLPNPLRPTSAVGAHPETSHQHLDRCPGSGAGLPLVSPFREPCVVRPVGADTRHVCRWQTACDLPYFPQPFGGRESTAAQMQARASETFRVASNRLSFSIQPQRCQRAQRCRRTQQCHRARRSWVRAGWKKTAGPEASVETLAGASNGARRLFLSFAGG